MTHDGITAEQSDRTTLSRWQRRSFLGAGMAVTASMLAGCTSVLESTEIEAEDTPSPPEEGSATDSGRFHLLISDQPVAIDEFDSLEVTLDEARIFGGPTDDTPESTPDPTPTPDEPPDETPSPTPEQTPTPTEPTPTPTPDADAAGKEEEGATDTDPSDGAVTHDSQRGFFYLDLDGATVDLTEVIGDISIEVFDGELPAGRYTKLELYPDTVVGIVEGEEVTVHVPSDKLMITHPFELEPDGTVEFVFDINVVGRGQTGEYNLTPVIAKSGIVGEDVETTVIGSTTNQTAD